MLISKTGKVKWNPRNKKRLVDLGYEFTKMDDYVDVLIEDLSIGSIALVTYECDYCHEQHEIKWRTYNEKKRKTNVDKDCCEKCLQLKAKDGLMAKFGTTNIREVEEINEKRKRTNIERYGCENPFGNKDVQEKIKEYYRENFGVEHDMQVPENVEKARNTSMERYGVPNYGAVWSKEHSREKSPTWKGDNILHERTERGLPEYRDWRKAVFARDHYTCQKCGDRNYDGRGGTLRLEAHHIFDWKNNPSLRTEIDNGITFCQSCHVEFHIKYGKKGNNSDQLKEFLEKSDEKIC